MILDTYDSIMDLLKFNLSIRLSDYRLFSCNSNINQINQNNYFITHPDFNIYPAIDYIEPNRWEILNNQILSLPYFNNFDELIKIIINPVYNSFCDSLFSKGINRLISLKDLINTGCININIKCRVYININIYTNIETEKYTQEILKPIIYWNQITNNEQIQIIALWIIYNQVFSDANHRTAHYILERYIIDGDFVIADFIKYAITKSCCNDFGMISWDNNMHNLINIVKDYRYSCISNILE